MKSLGRLRQLRHGANNRTFLHSLTFVSHAAEEGRLGFTMALDSPCKIARPCDTGRFWVAGALLGALLAAACGSDSGRSNAGSSSGGSSAEAGGGTGSGSAMSGGSTGRGGTSNGNAGTSNTGGTSNANGGTSNGNAGTSNGNAGTSNGNAGTSNGNAGTSNGNAGTSNGNAGTSNASGGSAGASSGGTAGSGGTKGASGGMSSAGGGGGQSSSLDQQIQGVYCGNSTDAITQFETWFGKHTGGILGYTGNASWQDYDGSVGWATGLWSALDRRVLWSVPLIPTGANLADAAAGMYDDHYKKAAQTLSTYRPQESVLYVRTGWEFNGDWFPWTALGGKAKNFAGAFQHFVAAFRSVSSRFRFEWNVNLGDSGMNPDDAYPGDASVDIVGMDFYWNLKYDPADPGAAWNSKLTQKYGLQWHQDFAAAHHKPTSYSEWGIMSDQAGPYIQQAKAWFASHDVVYQTYWNSNSDFSGMLSGGQYPNAGTAYKAAFGQ